MTQRNSARSSPTCITSRVARERQGPSIRQQSQLQCSAHHRPASVQANGRHTGRKASSASLPIEMLRPSNSVKSSICKITGLRTALREFQKRPFGSVLRSHAQAGANQPLACIREITFAVDSSEDKLLRGQTCFCKLARDQIPSPRSEPFLLLYKTAQPNDFHPIQQRPRSCVQRIRSRHESVSRE